MRKPSHKVMIHYGLLNPSKEMNYEEGDINCT